MTTLVETAELSRSSETNLLAVVMENSKPTEYRILFP